MKRGIDIVLEYSGFKEKIKGIGVCFKGEGAMDFQTKFGKTSYGVTKAMEENNPDAKVIAIVGNVSEGIEELNLEGVDAVFPTAAGASSLEELIETASHYVSRTVENIIRTLV